MVRTLLEFHLIGVAYNSRSLSDEIAFLPAPARLVFGDISRPERSRHPPS